MGPRRRRARFHDFCEWLGSVLCDKGVLNQPFQGLKGADGTGKIPYISKCEEFSLWVFQDPRTREGPLHSVHIIARQEKEMKPRLRIDLPDYLDWVDDSQALEDLALQGLVTHIQASTSWILSAGSSQTQLPDAAHEAYYRFNRLLRTKSPEGMGSTVQVRWIPGGRGLPGEFRFDGTGVWPRHFQSVRKIRRCVQAPLSKEYYDASTKQGWENCELLGCYLYFLYEDILRSTEDKRARFIV